MPKDDITGYKKVVAELYSKEIAQKLKIKSVKNDESKLDSFKQRLSEFVDVTALIAAYPKTLNVSRTIQRGLRQASMRRASKTNSRS
jgi:hypothetical protein